jgi:hypothetical protein
MHAAALAPTQVQGAPNRLFGARRRCYLGLVLIEGEPAAPGRNGIWC